MRRPLHLRQVISPGLRGLVELAGADAFDRMRARSTVAAPSRSWWRTGHVSGDLRAEPRTDLPVRQPARQMIRTAWALGHIRTTTAAARRCPSSCLIDPQRRLPSNTAVNAKARGPKE